MQKHWKYGNIEITICGAVARVRVFNVIFEKVGNMWQLTNVEDDDKWGVE